MPILITEIECVQKEGTLIVGICGKMVSLPSEGVSTGVVPTMALIRAIDKIIGPVAYQPPDEPPMFIKLLPNGGPRRFFLGDESGENLLDEFPECNAEADHIQTEDGHPIITEDGKFILTE